jgi:hypothetical protein
MLVFGPNERFSKLKPKQLEYWSKIEFKVGENPRALRNGTENSVCSLCIAPNY